MKFDSFDEWKLSVSEMNTQADAIAKNRAVAYDKMEKEIIRIFSENGMTVSSVTSSTDCSEFQVQFVEDTKNEIKFPKQLILDLGVSFSVVRYITKTGEQKLLLKIYPLE